RILVALGQTLRQPGAENYSQRKGDQESKSAPRANLVLGPAIGADHERRPPRLQPAGFQRRERKADEERKIDGAASPDFLEHAAERQHAAVADFASARRLGKREDAA